MVLASSLVLAISPSVEFSSDEAKAGSMAACSSPEEPPALCHDLMDSHSFPPQNPRFQALQELAHHQREPPALCYDLVDSHSFPPQRHPRFHRAPRCCCIHFRGRLCFWCDPLIRGSRCFSCLRCAGSALTASGLGSVFDATSASGEGSVWLLRARLALRPQAPHQKKALSRWQASRWHQQ